MVTVVVLAGFGVVLAALWSMAAGAWSIQIVLGSVAAVVVVAALGRALRRPAGRAVGLGLASVAAISFSMAFWSFRRPDVPPGLTVNQVAFALGVALAILAVEEGIRAVLQRAERARAVPDPHPDVGHS